MTSSRALIIASVLVASFTGAVAMPLLTYTATLAMFGLAHVATELHYVRARFGPRLHRRLSIMLILLLAGVVSTRALGLMGWLAPQSAQLLELAFVTGLVASTMPMMWRRGAWRAGWVALISAAIIAGMLVSPIHTLLCLAVAHNVTPIGFLLEAAPRSRRAVTALGSAALFVGAPLLIASGWPAVLLGELGVLAPEVSLLPAGPLAAHLGAYLPREWHDYSWANHAFSAVVFAQCMHYAVVIGVLPRLLGEDAFAQGRRRVWWMGVLSMSAVMLVWFWLDFAGARKIYGIASAVHAWVELPILILALSALDASSREAPRQESQSMPAS